MRFAVVLSALALLIPSTSARPVSAQDTGLVSLDSLRDSARPLLIFAPKPDDPQLEIQLRTLNEHAPAMREREVVPIAIPYRTPSPTPAGLNNADGEAARRRFHVAPGQFAVILLGKDGGEKLRSDKPLSMTKLNSTVDAMPMRQEMHGKRRPQP